MTLYHRQWGSWINNSIFESDPIRLLNLEKNDMNSHKLIQHVEKREYILPCSIPIACLDSYDFIFTHLFNDKYVLTKMKIHKFYNL